jgi:hypothetical protein
MEMVVAVVMAVLTGRIAMDEKMLGLWKTLACARERTDGLCVCVCVCVVAELAVIVTGVVG